MSTQQERDELKAEMREAIDQIMRTPGGFQHWSDLMGHAIKIIEELEQR